MEQAAQARAVLAMVSSFASPIAVLGGLAASALWSQVLWLHRDLALIGVGCALLCVLIGFGVGLFTLRFAVRAPDLRLDQRFAIALSAVAAIAMASPVVALVGTACAAIALELAQGVLRAGA